jgi:hypothetical protein
MDELDAADALADHDEGGLKCFIFFQTNSAQFSRLHVNRGDYGLSFWLPIWLVRNKQICQSRSIAVAMPKIISHSDLLPQQCLFYCVVYWSDLHPRI